MKQLHHSENDFFSLIKAGLWEGTINPSKLSINNAVNWDDIYQLAEEQSVVGIVAAGFDRCCYRQRAIVSDGIYHT